MTSLKPIEEDGVIDPVKSAALSVKAAAAAAATFSASGDIILSDDRFFIVPELTEKSHSDVASEFVRTEMLFFTKCIRPLWDFYLRPLNARDEIPGFAVINPDEHKLYFEGLGHLCNLHMNVFSEILADKWIGISPLDTSVKVLNLLQRMLPALQFQLPVSLGGAQLMEKIEKVRSRNARLAEFMMVADKVSGTTLNKLVKIVLMRLQQILAFSDALVEKASLSSEERLTDGFIKVKDILETFKEKFEEAYQSTNEKDIRKVQDFFGNAIELVAPGRVLIKVGHLTKLYKKKLWKRKREVKYFFALLSDCIVYGVGKSAMKKAKARSLPMKGLKAREVLDGAIEGVKNGIRLNSSTKSFIVMADNPEMQKNWITAINATSSAFESASKDKKKPEIYLTRSISTELREFGEEKSLSDTTSHSPVAPSTPEDSASPGLPRKVSISSQLSFDDLENMEEAAGPDEDDEEED